MAFLLKKSKRGQNTAATLYIVVKKLVLTYINKYSEHIKGIVSQD
jgi:hypothetical protein